ncbi:uncharacterized protein PV09_02936 [Verruconis gallopava]|uniref:non-reducing end alpha-L-arabinofuranosidase n=1 Tax=Verruconis gallopava TaxID=253628 RepID=A0A0D1XUU6_9PEZI|nr:uncharacterized protein PV09_02936 [Verruconis gallopava]KIW06501.1 hypothetical protein PV09_02936 [Verruconis gallopava]
MSSYTRIGDNETPVITINTAHKLSRINDNIYGGFTEHMGRCIYGGIYDPGSSLSDSNGFRKDVIAAMKELRVPVVRYPGGNFVATYHWLDGVGPKEQRPKRPELAWLGVETNDFGTDEFMKWCEVVGTEPYLCLNMGTGTLDEAMAWLEYCNGEGNTYYANLRRKNGREKPYKVKYWALGNEMWGPWQIEQMTKEDYAKKAYQWAKALKLLDPSIILILCGQDGTSDWDRYVLQQCVKLDLHGLSGDRTKSLIDMHSIHIYTASNEALPNATGVSSICDAIVVSWPSTDVLSAPRSAERAIEITSSLIDLARIENKVPNTVPRQTICFDEWNVWDPVRAPGELGAEESYTLSDALAVASWLNVFVRQSKYVGMANIAQSVNVISPLMTTKTGIVKQTTWWPLLLFSKYMRGTTLSINVACGEYEGPTTPDWIRGTVNTPWLDCSASISDDGWVTLAVVNVHETTTFDTLISGIPENVIHVYTVTGSHSGAKNTESDTQVAISETQWDGKGKYSFPKHSFTMLRWKAQ